MPNYQRQKGDRFERALVKVLNEVGISAHRVPLSGAVEGYPGDLLLDAFDPPIIVQCKHFADDFKRLFKIVEEAPITWVMEKPAEDEVSTPFIVMRFGTALAWMKSPHPIGLERTPARHAPMGRVAAYLAREDILFVKRDRGDPFVVFTLRATARFLGFAPSVPGTRRTWPGPWFIFGPRKG